MLTQHHNSQPTRGYLNVKYLDPFAGCELSADRPGIGRCRLCLGVWKRLPHRLRSRVFHLQVCLRNSHHPQRHHGHLDMLQNMRRPSLGEYRQITV